MAIISALAFVGHDRLRYFIDSTANGESISIESDGGASPDMLTDSLAGPLKQIFKVKTQGFYSVIPVGGITTQAQARGLLLSHRAGLTWGVRVLTAITTVTPITGGANWLVDAVRGPSDTATPGLTITNITGGAASCIVDISIAGSIGA